jgi:hypothetical protein
MPHHAKVMDINQIMEILKLHHHAMMRTFFRYKVSPKVSPNFYFDLDRGDLESEQPCYSTGAPGIDLACVFDRPSEAIVPSDH